VIDEHCKGMGTHPEPVLLTVHEPKYPLQSECKMYDDDANEHYFT
jgi:hypothetical protein